ncbi:MAG: putative sugar phosphate isomerase YwlF [Spirochaetes bacterium ADurb.Bin001]|nr:MAG: putative sugar phosphate isomerase YwlF [Spirochaetes bacterium ADurb.Bin001]
MVRLDPISLANYSILMKILIANDHGAVALKFNILRWLETQGHVVVNLGVDTEDRVDYPDQAALAVTEYFKGSYDLGIVCCGTGIGISIAANRFKGIRCALIHDSYTARMAKEHNNANFLAFGGRVDYKEPVEELLSVFLHAEFRKGRHAERVAKLDTI